MSKRDLFLVVADLDAENVFKTLLGQRQEALGISLDFIAEAPPNGDLLRYSGRDCGCYGDAVELLRPPQKTHRHAVICFDHHGSGAEGESCQEIEDEIEKGLRESGWAQGSASAVVIQPELEAWAWADSSEVANAMGWNGDMHSLRNYLCKGGFWDIGEMKPSDPKKAMQQAVKEKCGRGVTAPLFAELARKVGVRSCRDRSFTKFRNVLQRWFPRLGSDTSLC